MRASLAAAAAAAAARSSAPFLPLAPAPPALMHSGPLDLAPPLYVDPPIVIHSSALRSPHASRNPSRLLAPLITRRYSPEMLAEDTRVVADLRPYNKSVDFIGRVTHNTTGGYVDDISFTITPAGDAVTAVAFASSGIGGAYCDSGQNYKELVMLFEAIQAGWTMEHLDGSCGGGDTEFS